MRACCVKLPDGCDFHLWKSFAKHEELFTLDSVLSGFRAHGKQKSLIGGLNSYYAEVGGLSFMSKVLRKTHFIRYKQKIASLTSRRLYIKVQKYLS